MSLERVEVKPNTYTRYKSPGEFISPGLYYKTHAKLHLNERLKKGLASVACTDDKGRFCWLLPYECWIKRVLQGWEPPESLIIPVTGSEFPIPGKIWDTLRAWQRATIDYAWRCLECTGQYRRGIIAPLGSGKTLFGLCLTTGFQNPVVLAPKHLHGTWESEAEKWGIKCPRLSTYESCHKVDLADCVIADESLHVKNPTAARSRKAGVLAAGARCVVAFTATPSSVHPPDLRWSNLPWPGCLPSDLTAWQFLWGLDTELVEVAEDRKVYVTKEWDSKAIAEFTRPFISVVDLKEIAAELPDIMYTRILTPKPAKYDLILAGAGTEGGVAKRIAQARQLADGHFLDDLGNAVDMDSNKIDVIAEIVEGTEEPVVIFAMYDHSVKKLAERFKELNPALLRGGSDYGPEVERFRSGKTDLLISNACINTGMNLQRSRIVIFMSNGTSPSGRTQAVGRLVRPGNKASSVQVIDVLAEGTLDKRLLELLNTHAGESEAYILARLSE